MNSKERALTAQDTLEILKRGYYHNSRGERIDIAQQQTAAEENTRLYRPEELLELIESPEDGQAAYETACVVNDLTTLDSVRNEYPNDHHLLCLNYASTKNPGGGFLKGARAQEESIARASGLYPCQLKAENYYKSNRRNRSCLYTHHMIYTPSVPVIKKEQGELMDQPVFPSIITAPAVNAGAVHRNEPGNVYKIEPVMRQRIDMLLALCRKHGHKTLILGAWGCGVFRNEPADIARLFKDLLFGKYNNQFERVVFSVYSRNERFILPFREHFVA